MVKLNAVPAFIDAGAETDKWAGAGMPEASVLENTPPT
jgi:hypothetical protein